jgi:hypothetical protein
VLTIACALLFVKAARTASASAAARIPANLPEV